MSVNPIGNLQAMLPNSSEVGNIQNKMNQQVNAAQDFGNTKLQQESEDKQFQVYAKDAVEGEKIRSDDERNKQNGNGYSRSNHKHKAAASPQEDEDNLSDAIRGHNIDIKL
ncbi:hypothetical protein [Pectinatus frisingensis]|uniref:hypothetical protein n=1 Tax=Pectinatus frisingensis TaxID=865 RepID=UPI0018C74363|nr:hypothetical protein [Pectinatus frisingensis]